MKSDWILDVLKDLRTFAIENGLPVLAEQLDDTAIIAMVEIAGRTELTGGQHDAGRADSSVAGEVGAI
ncbi:hypothetical protein [Pseudosulfitobacter koreensis]|uniref:Uncharacterized protein n=1 Tax=Pseudosulfitobacter koreensis TaxID=2968472 RepID=A0ABT1Z2T6_9RHOB|nr:hypothetical protein [Pseudosulfitobacter koreense]MCR8827425.1 hypothetical protein [Pseudosulfitobacter koreense]